MFWLRVSRIKFLIFVTSCGQYNLIKRNTWLRRMARSVNPWFDTFLSLLIGSYEEERSQKEKGSPLHSFSLRRPWDRATSEKLILLWWMWSWSVGMECNWGCEDKKITKTFLSLRAWLAQLVEHMSSSHTLAMKPIKNKKQKHVCFYYRLNYCWY